MTGQTADHVRKRLPAALESRMQAMLEDGDAMPEDEDIVDGGIMAVEIPEPAHAE